MKLWLKVLIILVVIVLGLSVYWVLYLSKAHSTFDNYYAFRGCKTLITKTNDYGTCQLKSGDTIKIVKSNGKWYLDSDLSSGFLSF